MDDNEIFPFIRRSVSPSVVEIEMARRLILEDLSTLSPDEWREIAYLREHVRRQIFAGEGPLPEGYLAIIPDLNFLKATLTTCETIHILHATGVLVAAGPPWTPLPATIGYRSERGWSKNANENEHRIYPPVVNQFYRLATAFQGSMFPLADGNVYLSTLNHALLSSRVKRCLQEAIDAFRHGLFLSVTMNVGAASEGLWIELGQVAEQKTPSTARLRREINLRYPSIGTIMDEAWQALLSHAHADLLGVVGKEPDLSNFKIYADRVRDWRNYAMHSTDASIDERRFTYNITGMMLLDAADYFNKLARLIETMHRK